MTASPTEPARILTAGDVCPDLDFEEGPHVFRLQGVRLISLTQVAGVLGLVDVAFFTEADRHFGRLRHLVTELDDLGDLDESTVDPALMPTLEGWRDFKRSTGFTPIHVELRLYSDFGFATILDRVGTFPDVPGLSVVELKGPSDDAFYRLQTAAQARAVEERTGVTITHRCAVHMAKNGDWGRPVVHDSPRDLPSFLGCLTAAQWKIANGRIKGWA